MLNRESKSFHKACLPGTSNETPNHFAYVGRAAGFPGCEIQIGAGYAEIFDPAHEPSNSEAYVREYECPDDLFEMIGPTPWDPSTLNFGDNPEDHEAVTLGIQMWKEFGGGMTRAQYQAGLAKTISKLARCSPLGSAARIRSAGLGTQRQYLSSRVF